MGRGKARMLRLKLTPRKITFVLLFAFAGLLAFRHFTYVQGTQHSDLSSVAFFEDLENFVPFAIWAERTDYDFHLAQQKLSAPHPDVAVVEIEERSLREIGQFPFPRRIYRRFLQNLEKAGAKVVAFDITFPEEEQNRTLQELRSARDELTASGDTKAAAALAAKIDGIDGDQTFAQGLRETKIPVVMGFALANSTQEEAKSSDPLLNRHVIEFINGRPSKTFSLVAPRVPVRPHETLMKAMNEGTFLGSFDSDPDSDSVIRKTKAAVSDGYRVFPTLATRAVASYLGVTPALTVRDGDLFLTEPEGTGRLKAPLSSSGSTFLRYYGQKRTFHYEEFADVYNGKPESLAKLKGKIVFVGATATGLKDLRASPFDKDYPGVEVHATYASNLLKGEFIVQDSRYFLWGYAFIFSLVVAVSLLVHRIHPVLAFLGTGAMVAAFQWAAQHFFFDKGIVVPTLLPSFAALSMLFVGVIYRYVTEESAKKATRAAFSRYVSGAVVEEILKDPTKLGLGGQKRELTVMFCDLVGFTKLSESMDAAALTQRLNEYFTRMTRLILQNHGTLDKYMGDAIMCFWGAPLELKDHAQLACRTAEQMVAELHVINAEWKEKYDIEIGMRIGIHTGEVAVGNMGSEQVFSYTVMGDNVNLASRLEGVNNFYGTQVMVSAATAKAAGGEFRFRVVDSVKVKGKEEAVEIAELLANRPGNEDEWLRAYAEGLAAYRAGKFPEAAELFGACLAFKSGDGPAAAMIERLIEMEKKAPPGWDGAWKLTSK